MGEPWARREERICLMALLAEQRLLEVLEVSLIYGAGAEG